MLAGRKLATLLVLLGGLMVVAMIAAACGGDDEEKGVIRFHDPAWETIEEHNAIASYIVEKGYGYLVEIIPGDTGTMEVALPAGDLDVNMELWQANIPDWYAEFVVEKGLVVDLAGTFDPVANGAKGQIIEATDQGWYIPTYVAEANPGLKSVSDLPNYIELFQDPEDSSRASGSAAPPARRAQSAS